MFSVNLLLVVVPLLQAKRELRVAIYPTIPDLADDKHRSLLSWIENTFEMEYPGIDLKVSTAAFDIYDIDGFKDHFTSDPTAPHIVEIDTELLGEIVDEGLIAQIDPHSYGLNTPEAYLPFALEAVQYNGNYYGVPTYICGNYLMGINVGDVTQTCPLQNGVASYFNLSDILNQCEQDLLIPPRTMTVAGNFLGSFTLSNVYIDAYIDHHGSSTVNEAISSDIEAQMDVIADMRSFMDYCQVQGDNECLDGTFKMKKCLSMEILHERLTITGYMYSEIIGSLLQHAINYGIDVDVYSIIAPPLGPQNNFLMFTDALIVNKALLTTSEIQEDIDIFINFYSRLTTRLSIAFGIDLPSPHPPRYLMQARKDFYATEQVSSNTIYSALAAMLQYAVAAPNNGLYHNRRHLRDTIMQALDNVKNLPLESAEKLQCELISEIHPRDRSPRFEDFVHLLQTFNRTFTTNQYWEVLPEAKSNLMCIPNTNAALVNNINPFGIYLFMIMNICTFISTY